MKTTSIVLIALLTASAGCDREPGMEDRRGDEARAPADAATAPPGPDAPARGATGMEDPAVDAGPPAAGAMAPAGDADALGLLGAINRHEIDAARQAEEMGVAGPVLEYAQRMQREHADNQRKLEALGVVPATGEAVRAQEEKGRATRERLAALSGQAYADAYLEAMVEDHAEALALLEGRLIPAASDEAVRSHLQQTADAVRTHLDHARTLQADTASQR